MDSAFQAKAQESRNRLTTSKGLLLARAWCWAILLSLALAARAGGPYGADNGWAVDHNSGAVLLTPAVAAQMSAGETGWIRIEMYLVNGHSTWDSTVLGYYDAAVNNARNAGLQVLLLIDGGSWPGGQTAWTNNNAENIPGANGDNQYVEAFATNAVWPIVQHFRDRVKVYELWNEPNCWTANPAPGVYTGCTYIYPSNYGWLLARSWETVHITHQINDVILFFGGVFGHNIGGVTSYANAGAQYVDDTYKTGTNVVRGQSFNYTRTNYGAYPLDGVGQHLYLNQGGTVSSNTFRQYEDWVHQACTRYEGTNTPKKTFITEFGWKTTNSVNTEGVSQAVQKTNLITAFSAINATPYVQMAIWFQWADNPAGSMYYGVTNASTGPKLAFGDYQRFERFEGICADGSTNAGTAAYFSALGQAVLGNPFDSGHGAWVYAFLNGYAQDYAGGSHLTLTLMSSTNGTFEMNDVHGVWSWYNTNNGPAVFGYLLGNAYAYGDGIRQDFSSGYLTWDAVNGIVPYPGNLALPVITAQPQSQIVIQGSNVLFSVTATNALPLSYQWRFNGANLPTATTWLYSLTSAQPANAGSYAVVVSNSLRAVTSDTAVLWIKPILALTPNGGLTWSGTFTLQSATNAAGPYVDVPGAISPYTNRDTGLPGQFFRLRN